MPLDAATSGRGTQLCLLHLFSEQQVARDWFIFIFYKMLIPRKTWQHCQQTATILRLLSASRAVIQVLNQIDAYHPECGARRIRLQVKLN